MLAYDQTLDNIVGAIHLRDLFQVISRDARDFDVRALLLTADELVKLPPPEPLVGDLLPLKSLAVLWGRWGSAKYFVALDWALCVSGGLPWQGQEVSKGAVLYIAAEGDDNGGYDFSDDAREMYGATATVDKRLQILPGTQHGVALVAGSARVRALIEGFVRKH